MKLSADKRNKLIGVAIVTAAVIGALWYFVVEDRNVTLQDFKEKQADALTQRKKIDNAIKGAGKIEQGLKDAAEKLAVIQQEMASGDLYSWMYTTIKNFKAAYHVDIPQFSTVETADNTLLYKFPYKQVKMTISGSAYFHDFGKFLSDFENRFPHIRVENLVLEPTSGADRTADREKLAFRMEIIALVNSAPANDNNK